MKKDYYEILGVPKDSTQEYIKRAYRLLAHQYHPDKNDGNEKRFKEVHEAYLALSDEQSKEEYDKDYNKSKIDGSDFYKETYKEAEPLEENEKVKKEPKINIEKTKKSLKYTGGLIYAVGVITIFVNSAFYFLNLFGVDISDLDIPIPNHSSYFAIVVISIIYIILGKRIRFLNDIKTKLYLQIVIILSFLSFILIMFMGGAVGILFFILLTYLIVSLIRINKAMKVKEFTSTLTNHKYKFSKKNWISFGFISIIIFGILFWVDASKVEKGDSSNNEPTPKSYTLEELEKLGATPVDSTQEIKEPVLPVPVSKSETKNFNPDISNWITYKSDKDGFGVLFPQNPEIETTKVSNASSEYIDRTSSYTAISKTKSFIFTLKNMIFIKTLPPEGIDLFLSSALKTSMSKGKEITSSSYGYYKNNRILNFNINDKANNLKFKGRIIYANNIYLLEMGYDDGNYDEEIYNKFVNSFEAF